MDYLYYKSAYLAHHGIKGQKWGVRRFQNEDGTWTAAGKAHRNDGGDGQSVFKKMHDASVARNTKKVNKMYDKINSKWEKKANKLEAKGKTAKAAVAREFIRYNNESRDRQIKNFNESKSMVGLKAHDMFDAATGFRVIKGPGNQNMATMGARLTERVNQFMIRNVDMGLTLDKTLKNMASVDRGREYLIKKRIVGTIQNSSYNSYRQAQMR